MADEFTDSEDERAVEDVLSQALDQAVLEQISAINCSSFSTSDNLPFELENRFRKLKSLPTTTAAHPPPKSKSFTPSSVEDLSLNKQHNPGDFKSIPDLKKSQQRSDQKKGTDSKSKSRTGSSESSSSTDDPEEYSDGYLDEKTGSKSTLYRKTRSLKLKSGTGSSSPESRSVSPAGRGIGCLWCSPKRKQGKENRLSSSRSFSSSWGNDYDVDFVKTFSMKEHKKIMNKVIKEEEKLNKEAEKIVKWAKQVSSKMMDVSGLESLDDVDQLTPK